MHPTPTVQVVGCWARGERMRAGCKGSTGESVWVHVSDFHVAVRNARSQYLYSCSEALPNEDEDAVKLAPLARVPSISPRRAQSLSRFSVGVRCRPSRRSLGYIIYRNRGGKPNPAPRRPKDQLRVTARRGVWRFELISSASTTNTTKNVQKIEEISPTFQTAGGFGDPHPHRHGTSRLRRRDRPRYWI